MEKWKPIAGFENYAVSNHGRVKRIVTAKHNNSKAGRLLTPTPWGNYRRISLYTSNGSRRNRKVAVLVAIAFVPNPKHLPMVNHTDGVKTNDKSSNLEWTTNAGNVQHACDTGLKKPMKGSLNAAARLSTKQVLAIRKRFAKGGITKVELGRIYGVSDVAIHYALTGATWKHAA